MDIIKPCSICNGTGVVEIDTAQGEPSLYICTCINLPGEEDFSKDDITDYYDTETSWNVIQKEF